MADLKRLDQSLFNQVAEQSRQRYRLRCNHNLHQDTDVVQRFLNVLQPGTYVRPHRHCREQQGSGFECFLVLQGAIGLLVLNEDGVLLETEILRAAGPVKGIELAENQFHTLVALEPDSVIFELKQGPYQPTHDKDFIASFPQEGTPEACQQELHWRAFFQNDVR